MSAPPAASSLPLPPGSSGLPLVGETLAFLGNGFAFVDDRVRRHGPVFRTRILGRDAVVLTGTEGSDAFVDPDKVMREGSMPPHVERLFGGRSLPLLDGAAHRERKRQIFAGFDRAALASYVAALDALVVATLDRWGGAGEIRLVDESKRLAFEGICRNVLDLPPGGATDALRADYAQLLAGFTALPVPLPGSPFAKALAARERIFAALDGEIRRHRVAPSSDALARILSADVDGRKIDDDAARLELHHVVIAGFIIYAHLFGSVLRLVQEPDRTEALRGEVAAALGDGALGPEALAKMPALHRFAMEVKRLAPILPAVFGRARRDFAVGGHRVPAGTTILWGWWANLRDPHVFADAERFDPERFAPPRSEQDRHPNAFVPHGAGEATGHRCPGADYATLFLELFLVRLLERWGWEAPPQDLSWNWKGAPPEPRDGLRLRLRRRE